MTDVIGRPATDRRLIVNGDDFGRTPGINRGIRRAHEQGILTSASLMVRWPAAAEAASYARDRPTMSLGLHVDLGEWVHQDGTWEAVYMVVPAEDAEAVADEVARQLRDFRRLAGRPPTHVDSHQHVHLREPVRSVILAAVRPMGIPTRACTPEVHHRGDFHGQSGKGEPWPEGITVDALVGIVAGLPVGVTEIGCHPGEDDDFENAYRFERTTELAALCDPRVRAALTEHAVRLTTFQELAGGAGHVPG